MPKRDVVGLQALDGAVFAFEDGRIVSGAEIAKIAGGGIEFGEECSGEAPGVAVGADLAVETTDEFGERAAGAGQGSKAGLECCHHHGGGDAFASYVGYRDQQRTVARAKEGVVVVAADGLGGAHGEGDVDAGNVGGSARDEPSLDFAGDFDVALHRDVIAEDQSEEDQQADEGEQEIRFPA